MKPLIASALLGLVFAACGGKVTVVEDDAATDTAPTRTATDAPAPTPTMTHNAPLVPDVPAGARRPVSHGPLLLLSVRRRLSVVDPRHVSRRDVGDRERRCLRLVIAIHSAS